MAQEVPFARLGVPDEVRPLLASDAPIDSRLEALRGAAELEPAARLGVLYVLSCDPSHEVKASALEAVRDIPLAEVMGGLAHDTHSKILELLVVLRGDDQALAGKIYKLLSTNDRTAVLIAEKAGPDLCEHIAYNHERLLITPKVVVALHGNPACPDSMLEKAASFLRMNRMLPPLPATRAAASGAEDMDLEAEIEAALGGEASPSLGRRAREKMELFELDEQGSDGSAAGFSFDFDDEMEAFSWDLMDDNAELSHEDRLNVEKKVNELPVSQKVKLAYLGNRETRSVLVRDRNKLIAVSVIKSGRCSDGEVASIAANRNVHDEVLREVANNREWTRKYPVKVALVNNPKTPVSVAVGMVSSLQKRDLMELTHNHNVSSVVATMARRLYKQKYKANSR